MKALLFLLLLLAIARARDSVKVTVLIEAEDDEGDDYLQVQLYISKQHQSLGKAMSEAQTLADEISGKVKSSCQQHSNNKKQCGGTIEVGEPEVETKYQIVRKESTFQHFIVKREITFKVQKIDALGPLVDELQRLGVTKFEGFSWKGEDEQEEEETVIENARRRISNLCEAFDYKFDSILEVTQIQPEEEEGEKEDEGGDDEEEQEEPNVYQVVAECVSGKPAKK